MSASIAFASAKGGVGKTTAALNCAHAFARGGLRTLLVDLDVHGGLALSLDGLSAHAGLSAHLQAGTPLGKHLAATRLPSLSLLPMGRVAPGEADRLVAQARSRQLVPAILDEARDFDLVVFDTPTGLGGLTRLAFEAVEHVVAVAQCEPLALRALPALVELVAQLRQAGHACSLAGVIANMGAIRDARALAVQEELWSLYGDFVFETFIPRDPQLLDASRAGTPLELLSRRPSPVSAVFVQLAAEIETRLDLRGADVDDQPIPLVG